MIFGLRILPAADGDVDAAASFIAQDNLEAALRFYDAVETTFTQLRHHPNRGPVYPTDHPRLVGIRRCVVADFPNYLVFYRIDAEMVEIIRVLRGARDIPLILSDHGNQEMAH